MQSKSSKVSVNIWWCNTYQNIAIIPDNWKFWILVKQNKFRNSKVFIVNAYWVIIINFLKARLYNKMSLILIGLIRHFNETIPHLHFFKISLFLTFYSVCNHFHFWVWINHCNLFMSRHFCQIIVLTIMFTLWFIYYKILEGSRCLRYSLKHLQTWSYNFIFSESCRLEMFCTQAFFSSCHRSI